jgi:beta-xylosidase
MPNTLTPFKQRLAPALALALLLSACGATARAQPARPKSHESPLVWSPDNGDGTYKNPIIFADYSDPDALRVGDDFYMTASSFNAAPGLPVLHSKDLVNWRIIAHVFQQQIPRDVFAKPQHGNGVWAPSIRHHRGEFYIYYPDPDFGIYLVKAKHPAGPWSEPLLVKAAKGWIDPCPLWDDDGQAYLVHAFANSRAGIKSVINVSRMTPDGTRLIGEDKMVFDGRQTHPTIEGPKFYRRNGYYYIFAPAGGVPTGWQTVLRSRSVWGPYEDRNVMDQGSTPVNGPHQGAWVELKSGEHWFLHFQDRGAYGRIVHLQPMRWIDDWPVIGNDPEGDGRGEPVLVHKKPNVGRNYPATVPQTSDEFDSARLGLQWQWQANFLPGWSSLAARRGSLRLFSVPTPDASFNFWHAPNLLLQKFPAPEFTTTTRVSFVGLAPGDAAGLVVMGMDYSLLAVEREAKGFQVRRSTRRDAIKGAPESVEAVSDLVGTSIFLRVRVGPEAVCRFSYSLDGRNFRPLGEPFKAREGRWIGAKVGLFAVARPDPTKRGFADFDWFRFE